MSARKHKEKEAKKLARLQAGKVLAAVKPAQSKEDIAKQILKRLDSVVSDVQKLLSYGDQIIIIRRHQGMISGLGNK
jgi:hypothetical protein